MDGKAGGGGIGENAEGFEGVVMYLVHGFRVLFSGVCCCYYALPYYSTTFLGNPETFTFHFQSESSPRFAP